MKLRLIRLLLCALCIGGALVTLSAVPTTLTFTTDAPGAWADGVANDGDGGSTDLAGQTLQIYMIGDTFGTPTNSALNYGGNDSFFALTSYAANGFEGSTRGMAIRSSDGSQFQINGFFYTNWGEGAPLQMFVSGYRDGIEVGSAGFTTSQVGAWQSSTVSLGAAFDNVDEVRIYSAAPSWHGINDIVIDTARPSVTDARIAISGGTGPGGAYRIGDTVTATWNNTAGGDNNLGVTGVTVDFSQFGGGAAVAATNSSSTWTAAYTVVAGAIDTTNRNVSVTATTAGGSTTTADTTNATVDSIAPAVTSVTVSGSPAATDTSMAFTVAFNDTVSNVSTDDFALVGTGSASGSIASVSASSGTSMSVTISGITGNGTLTVNLNGSTNIVDNAGNGPPAAYTAGSTHTVAIPTAPGAPTIGTATAGDWQASVTFTAPGSNGGSAITTYTATASPGGAFGTCAGPAACTITVTGLTNGTAYTFTVTATNAIGTSSASSASNSVTPRGNQTITFANPGAQNFGTTPTLTATATSSLSVTFSSSTTGVCTITSGGLLTFVTAGTCTIDADQAGNSAFNAASTVSRSFTVNAIVPGAPTIGTATAGDTTATVTFTAPASSGGAAITGYTVTSVPGGNTGTGAASPITVTGLTNGVAYTFVVTATNSAGTGANSSASNSVTPAAPQIITFTNPGAQNFGTAPTLSGTATSGLTVTFTSSTTGVCTVTGGGLLTFVTAGTCTINADQPGDSSFLPASQVSRSFSVNAVVAGAPTAAVATAGDAQASVAFAAPSFTGGTTITDYTVTSNPGGLTGTGAASPITVTGLTNGIAYTFTVTATNLAGTGPASAATNSVTPTATQTITFVDPGAQNFGTTPTLNATADSGLTPTFTSSTPGVCTITSGGALTFVSAGTCTILADQAGNSGFLPAPQVSRSFLVNAVAPGAPTSVVATAGDGQATVAFVAPVFTGGAAITGYTVTSLPGGFTSTGPASPVVIAGLANGVAYSFTVTATNSAGTGAASAASNVVTPEPSLPTVSIAVAPATVSEAGAAALVFTVTRSQMLGTATVVNVTLGGTATSGADYAGAVSTVTIPANATMGVATITPVADAVAEPDETVTVEIATGAGYIVGAPASATGTITNETSAPVGPSNFRITAMRGNQVALAWALPANDVVATGILLEGGDTPGAASGVGQLLTLAPAATVTLPTGSYYMRLRLMTSAGLSAPSNEIRAHVNVPVVPSAPAFLLGAADASALRLAWTPTFTGGAPTGAVVDVTGAATTSVVVASGDTFAFSGVPAGTYTFAVRQTNATGSSTPSSPVTLTFPSTCTAIPQTPVNVVAYSTAGRVYMQWDPPTSGPAPAGYALVVSGAFTGTLPVAGRTIDSPAPAGVYQLAVGATNACGTSALTPVQTIEVRSLTPAPAPQAMADTFSTPYGTALTVAAPGLLANDAANGGGTMVAAVVAAPGHGVVTLAATGGFTYTPQSGFSGTDTFTYRVATLPGGPSAAAYVSIAVGAAPGPRPPLAVADAYGTTVDTALTVAASSGVLANDDALGSTGLTAQVVTSPSHGVLGLAADGGLHLYAGGRLRRHRHLHLPSHDHHWWRRRPGDRGDHGGGRGPSAGAHQLPDHGDHRQPRDVRLGASHERSGADGYPDRRRHLAGLRDRRARAAGGRVRHDGHTADRFVLRPRTRDHLGRAEWPSNEVLVHANVPLAPSAPSALLGVVNGNAVHLAWTPTFGGGAPTGARVDVSGSINTSFTLARPIRSAIRPHPAAPTRSWCGNSTPPPPARRRRR